MASILLVDGNPVERRVVRMTLDLDGHRCAEAATGAEALGIIRDYPVDLVMIAMDLADLDGYQLIPSAHTLPGRERTPFVAILAQDDERGPVESFLAGAVDVLIQPFGSQDVRDVVARATSPVEIDLRTSPHHEAYETALRLQQQARADRPAS